MDKFLVIFIVILSYLLLLFILRTLEIGSKKANNTSNNYCPDCNLALQRIKRMSKDIIANYITFKIFDFKRYLCHECGWEGLRWERKYSPK